MLDFVPSSIPDPLPKWASWALQIPDSPVIPILQLLEFVGVIPAATDPSAGTWMHVQAVWKDLQSNDAADRMVTTFDVVNITGGGLDSTWNDSDFDTVDGHLTTLLTAWSAYMINDVGLESLKYYPRQYNPYSVAKPFPTLGPPVHIKALSGAGALVRPMPHQVAITSTDRTAIAKHWGRNYWPAPACDGLTIQGGGLIPSSFCDAWCTQLHDVYEAMNDDDFNFAVPATTYNNTPYRQLLGITSVQVDNVFDVVRRRRKNTTTYRKELPVS